MLELKVKMYINNKYQNIDVIVSQHENNVVCKYDKNIDGTRENASTSNWSFVLDKVKGVAVCGKTDIFDFNLGKRIAIKKFIIQAYGSIKAYNKKVIDKMIKGFNHERNLQTALQKKVKISLYKVMKVERSEVKKIELDEFYAENKLKHCKRCGDYPERTLRVDERDRAFNNINCKCGKGVNDAPSLDKAITTWNVMN